MKKALEDRKAYMHSTVQLYVFLSTVIHFITSKIIYAYCRLTVRWRQLTKILSTITVYESGTDTDHRESRLIYTCSILWKQPVVQKGKVKSKKKKKKSTTDVFFLYSQGDKGHLWNAEPATWFCLPAWKLTTLSLFCIFNASSSKNSYFQAPPFPKTVRRVGTF